MKKILIGLGATAAVIAPIASAVSCSGTVKLEVGQVRPSNDIKIWQATRDYALDGAITIKVERKDRVIYTFATKLDGHINIVLTYDHSLPDGTEAAEASKSRYVYTRDGERQSSADAINLWHALDNDNNVRNEVARQTNLLANVAPIKVVKTIDNKTELVSLLATNGAQIPKTSPIVKETTDMLAALKGFNLIKTFVAKDKKSSVVFFEKIKDPEDRTVAADPSKITWDLALDRDTDSFKHTYGPEILPFLKANPKVSLALEIVFEGASTNPGTGKNKHARLFELSSGTGDQVLAGDPKNTMAIEPKTFNVPKLSFGTVDEKTLTFDPTIDHDWNLPALEQVAYANPVVESIKRLILAHTGTKPVAGASSTQPTIKQRYFFTGVVEILKAYRGKVYNRKTSKETKEDWKTNFGDYDYAPEGYYMEEGKDNKTFAFYHYTENETIYLFTITFA
ncbi:MAG: hypothetical protein KAG04_01495 [Mycoplasmataceae bacterium]|nr:hypothetical protein [Mycoplasmataceae bacterium]